MRTRNKMSWLMAAAVGLGAWGMVHGAVIPPSEVGYAVDATTPVWGATPDGGDTLADGIVAAQPPLFTNAAGASNTGWLEFASSPSVLLHFNLGQNRNLSKLKIIYYTATADNEVANPIDVKVSFSGDNVTFSAPVTFTPFNGADNSINTATVDLSALSPSPTAKYVDVQVGLGSGKWTFLTEVQFESVPEPSGMMTGMGAAMGLFLLGGRSLRTRSKPAVLPRGG